MSPDWIGSAAATLVDSSFRITIAALLIGVLLFAARVRSSAMRHSAWTVVTVAMLVMPVLSAVVPAIAVPVPAPARAVFALPDIPSGFTDTSIPSSPRRASAPDSSVLPRAVAATRPRPARGPQTRASWLMLLMAVYASGTVFLLARLAIGWRAANLLVRSATRTSLGSRTRVLESEHVATPVTVGVRSPSVVLPSSWHTWPQDKLRAVLAHEVAHVRRRDPLALFIARLNRSVFWFHPLAWWLERRLAADAEHACDEVAVRETGEARRYAEVLLDMADEVRRHGGRVSRQGIGVDGNGLLGRRIDRVLRSDRISDPSRVLSVAVALGCLAVILGVAACRQTVTVAPLREDPETAQRLATQKAYQEFYERATQMTAGQVDQLEASLKKSPEDFDALEKLQIFYQSSGQKALGWDQMVARRRPHVLWLIEHHPEHQLAAWLISPTGDAEGYAAAKLAWSNQTAKADATAKVLSNAARFFERHDPQIAEDLLVRARKLDPEASTIRPAAVTPAPTYWSTRFGGFYASVLMGGISPTDGKPVRQIDADPFAQDVRRRLATSDDATMLSAVGLRLATGSLNNPARQQLGVQYLQRALQLDPNQIAARRFLFSTEDHERSWAREQALRLKQAALVGGDIERKVRAGERLSKSEAEKLRGAEYDAVVSLPEAERLTALADIANGSYMWAEHLGYTDKNEAGAQAAYERSKKAAVEALALAERLKDHPAYGTVFYGANVALATHALREGDRQHAVRFMLEATKAAPSERLAMAHSFGLDGRLVTYLLKAGERETVAEFLEKSAALRTSEKERLLRDAAAIRDGRMPLSYQSMMSRAP